jgi:hypothetical protein
MLWTDKWQSYHASHPAHATVGHSVAEWSRDDAGYGRQEVHNHTCEGAGIGGAHVSAGGRGVHKRYLHLYVATYQAMVNTKQVTSVLIQRIWFGDWSTHPACT